jgi:uncharacterized protein YciW
MMNRRLVDSTVGDLMAHWRSGPPIDVVARASDLPFNAPGDVQGAYLPKARRAFLVANNLLERAVAATAAHEVVGHFAVRQLHGLQAWRSLMAAVQAGADAGDERLEAARDFVRWVYVDEQEQRYLSRLYEADEVVAAFAEALIDHRTGRLAARRPWYSLWRAARGHVAREILLRDDPADFHEVEGVLLAAERLLRDGSPFGGLGKRWYCAAMESKPMGPARPARDLQESEDMLAAAEERSQWWPNFIGFWQTVALIAAVPLLLWLIFSLAGDVICAIARCG